MIRSQGIAFPNFILAISVSSLYIMKKSCYRQAIIIYIVLLIQELPGVQQKSLMGICLMGFLIISTLHEAYLTLLRWLLQFEGMRERFLAKLIVECGVGLSPRSPFYFEIVCLSWVVVDAAVSCCLLCSFQTVPKYEKGREGRTSGFFI